MPFNVKDLVIKIETPQGERVVVFCPGESCHHFTCVGPSGCLGVSGCQITVCTETKPKPPRKLEASEGDLQDLLEVLQQALSKLT